MLLTNPISALTSVLTLGEGYLMPKAESSFAGDVDFTMDFVNLVTLIFFVAIIVIMVLFVIKYRRREKTEHATTTSSHNTGLELAWSLPPMVIVMFMFYFGFTGYMKMVTVPGNAYQIDVTAKQWSWTFTHPNGYTSSTLDIPAGRPVVLQLSSLDVIHSLYIPAFRVKKDVVPGRYNTLWFIADAPTKDADAPLKDGKELDAYIRPLLVKELDPKGEQKLTPDSDAVTAALTKLKPQKRHQFAVDQQNEIAATSGLHLFCAEFCGTAHSLMLAKVVVHNTDWKAPKPTRGTPWQEGRKLFMTSCNSCHHLDPSTQPGTTQICPDFANGIYGQPRTWTDGASGTADEQYIYDSIKNPSAKVVAGGSWGNTTIMPLFNFKDQQIHDLVTFLKSPQKEPE